MLENKPGVHKAEKIREMLITEAGLKSPQKNIRGSLDDEYGG